VSDGVQIPYEVLNELNGSLKQIMVEFADAAERADDLEAAIGSPLGRTGLRTQAGVFESAWNDKRETLRQDMEEVQKHVEEIGKGWVNWDTEAASQLSVDPGESNNLPKAV